MKEILKTVGDRFLIPGELATYQPLTNGNINATYRVDYCEGDVKHAYVFQRINQNVFKKPVEIMQNIELVTSHIVSKGARALQYRKTAEGDSYYSDENGFWRVTDFLESVAFNLCTDLETVATVGEAFGQFQLQLSDLDGTKLHETIPDFHNTRRRIEHLMSTAEADPVGRVAMVQEELAFVASVKDLVCELGDRLEKGDFVVRVTHNDTKSNNVLLDKDTLRPLVVIDLDTVMPGMAMHDFGDAVRFICNTANEDEADLSKVSLDLDKYRAFCKGFIGQVKNGLTRAEIESMALGALAMTVELVVRFLDDYIAGDTYFKILYPEHNIVRTRCQMALAKDMLAKFDQMKSIVLEYC